MNILNYLCSTYSLRIVGKFVPFHFVEYIEEWCQDDVSPTKIRSLSISKLDLSSLRCKETLIQKKIKVDIKRFKPSIYHICGFLDDRVVHLIGDCTAVKLTLTYGIVKRQQFSVYYSVKRTKRGPELIKGDPLLLKNILLNLIGVLESNDFFTTEKLDKLIDLLESFDKSIICPFEMIETLFNPINKLYNCLITLRDNLRKKKNLVLLDFISREANDTKKRLISNYYELSEENGPLYTTHCLLKDFIFLIGVLDATILRKIKEMINLKAEDFMEHSFTIEKKNVFITKKLNLTYHNINPDLFDGFLKECIITKNYKLMNHMILFPIEEENK